MLSPPRSNLTRLSIATNIAKLSELMKRPAVLISRGAITRPGFLSSSWLRLGS